MSDETFADKGMPEIGAPYPVPADTAPLADPWGEVEVKLAFTELKVTVVDETKNAKGEKRKDGEEPLKRRFIMREMDGRNRDAYLTASNGRSEITADGMMRLTDFDGSCAELLSRMMYEVHKVDGIDVVDKSPITIGEVQKWPGAAQLSLYRKALPISGLHEKATAEAKND